MKVNIAIIFYLFSVAASAQLKEVSINHAPSSIITKTKSGSARTQSLKPLTLPFWDDFSFVQDVNHAVPNDTLYVASKSLWVNNGVGIKPPSIYTATFDGIDSLGKPYSLIDVLAKGFADRLISRPIKLDDLPGTQNDSVHFSFFYQPTGKREAPDTDDNLSLWFKDKSDVWQKVFEVGNSSALDPSVFYYKVIPLDHELYFHAGFQFKFQNFARLSGPYDSWNIDYIYLNKRRFGSDINSHDQAITQPITSIFKQYTAIPMKHFRDTVGLVLIQPNAFIQNLYKTFASQSTKYKTSVKIEQRINNIISNKTFNLEVDGSTGNPPAYREHRTFQLAETIHPDSIDMNVDSVGINFKIGISSGDNNTVPDAEFFKGLDFTINDSISSSFLLHKHYAYDDGTAEYGAGLNQAGTEMAYLFDMFIKEPDTVVAVDIHFPEFGDNTAQTLILKLWQPDNDTLPDFELHRQTIEVTRKTGNTFVRYTLSEPVGVQGRFFIGWEQKENINIPVGLDKNTNSGSKIFTNLSDPPWVKNQIVNGSLMIHPIFGKGSGEVISGVNEKAASLYPNPSNGEFYLPESANEITVFNSLGEPVQMLIHEEKNTRRVSLLTSSGGLFIVRWREGSTAKTSRLIVDK